ncbi:MAG: GMP/IMP nucleotidase [Pseudomonadales bacterium]|nr:GMP/IMP nucleotidase [Pseudomonadales bacterium]
MPDPRPDWHAIDTVCLDLDGTLLDLSYDNYIWTKLVPQRYAARKALSLEAAYADLAPRFKAREGTLEWYCIEFWSRELGLDIVALHHEAKARVGWLPGAQQFLKRLRAADKRVVLLTNSHPTTLAIKHGYTGVLDLLDDAASSAEFDAPKEQPLFWERAQQRFGFDPARSLFADDSRPVLHAAHAAGIRWVYGVCRPDSDGTAHAHDEFQRIDSVAELAYNIS